MKTNFPIDRVREEFPALKRTHNGKQVVYFDGPGGTQFVQGAIDAMRDYMTGGASNLGACFPTCVETEASIEKAKSDICALLGAKGCSVAFGANATTMMFHTARALARQWAKGDEIILSELDHHSNIDSWRTAAEERGVIVKYIPLDTNTLTLRLDALPELLTERTRLVAVSAASNCIGTRVDIKAVARLAKTVGALVAVDAVHAIPHFYIDMNECGIDMLFASTYKFFAAHVGMAIIREQVFESLEVYKVAPATDNIPGRMEIGTQNHEGIPAMSAAVRFIAGLGTGGTLTEQIKSGYEAIEAHEDAIGEMIRRELRGIGGITLYAAAEGVPKTPTIAFRAQGITPREFCERMCEQYSVFIANGDFYAMTLAEKLGIRESGGFIRAGLAPYNTMQEAKRFIEGVRGIMV